MCAIVAACLGFFVGLSVCVYQCYRRRSARNSPENRLSAAIRRGLLKEYRAGGVAVGGAAGGSNDSAEHGLAKSPSIRSTASSDSAGSSHRVHGGGGTDGSAGRTTGYQSGLSMVAVSGEGRLRSPTGQGSRSRDEGSNPPPPPPPPRSPEEKNDSCVGEKEQNEEKDVDGGQRSDLGTLQFSVSYDSEKTALVVAVVRAKDLPAKDVNAGSSDPYVKLQLLPDKKQKVGLPMWGYHSVESQRAGESLPN